MDNAGLVKDFKINRVLTQDEIKNRLNQKDRLAIEPHYQLSVIKLNSTYLETVDKWYGNKGLITGVALALMLILGLIGFQIISNWTLKAFGFIPKIGDEDNLLLYSGLLACILVVILVFLLRFLKKDSFAYTHYPTRFNRVTRMVHIFSPHAPPIFRPLG